MPTIADLREELRTVNGQARQLFDEMHAETDETRRAEKEAAFERADKDAERADKALRAAEKLEAREAGREVTDEARERDARGALIRDEGDDGRAKRNGRVLRGGRLDPREQREYLGAIEEYICNPGTEGRNLTKEQRSVLASSVDADGGYAVPESWTDLYLGLRDASPIREYCTILTTERGGLLHLPRRNAGITGVGIVAESTSGGAVTTPDDAPTLDELILPDFKLAEIAKASEEIVQDALFNVEGFLADELAFALGQKASQLYVAGTGAGASNDSQPMGLFPNAAVGVDNVASIGYDQLIDLEHSVIAPYRRNAQWVMNDLTAALIRKLKDSNNRPLWEWGLEKGRPPRLLGYEVVAEPFAPTNALSARPIAFGDLKRGYVIRDVLGLVIKDMGTRYADTGQFGWRGLLRTGGGIRDGAAIKVLRRAAS